MNNNSVYTKLPVIALLAFISCLLWGSAAPSIKTGYSLLNISSSDTPAIILFAGTRFTMAGIMVIAAGSLMRKKFLVPKAESVKNVIVLSLFQTTVQYIFFYIGVAHASGVKSSIMVSTNVFFSLLVAALVFRYETLNIKKIIGCFIGFAGVVLINVAGKSVDMKMSFTGEGFVVLSSLAYAFSAGFIKKFSKNEDTLTLSGWQFFIGGLTLCAAGYAAGGRIYGWTGQAVLVLCYLAFISAMAYSLWSTLLKYNPVSKVSVFGFLNPICGVVISAIVLSEQDQAFTLVGLVSLLLVCSGILVVNKSK